MTFQGRKGWVMDVGDDENGLKQPDKLFGPVLYDARHFIWAQKWAIWLLYS